MCAGCWSTPTCCWRTWCCARSWTPITSSPTGWPPTRMNRLTRRLSSPSASRWASSGSCSAGSPAPSRGRWNCSRPRCAWPGTVSWWTRSRIRTSPGDDATSPTRSPRPSGASTPSRSWPGGRSCRAVTLPSRAATRPKVGSMPLTGEYAPSPWDWSREQADKYAESGGTEAADMKGKPIILLSTIGAKSGKLRKTPLMRVEHDGEYAIVASLGGAPKNPVWYHNVVKNPRVELQDGSVTRDYDAREVFGDEKAAWWERAVEAWPDYAEYQKKTDRQIPVFVLTPVS